MPETVTLTTTAFQLPLAAPPSAPVATEDLGSTTTGTGAGGTGSRGTRKLEADANLIPPSTRASQLTLA